MYSRRFAASRGDASTAAGRCRSHSHRTMSRPEQRQPLVGLTSSHVFGFPRRAVPAGISAAAIVTSPMGSSELISSQSEIRRRTTLSGSSCSVILWLHTGFRSCVTTCVRPTSFHVEPCFVSMTTYGSLEGFVVRFRSFAARFCPLMICRMHAPPSTKSAMLATGGC